MNSWLSKRIAEVATAADCNELPLKDVSAEDAALINALSAQVTGLKLGKKKDKRGDRMAWLNCNDQAQLISDLQPSSDQRAFLEAVTLRLRVMTAVDEGLGVLVMDLFALEPVNVPAPGISLVQVYTSVPQSVEITERNFYLGQSRNRALPGTSEFADIQAIVNAFQQ